MLVERNEAQCFIEDYELQDISMFISNMFSNQIVRSIRRLLSALLIGLGVLLAAGNQALAIGNQLEHIKLPSGFKIEIYAEAPSPRSMALDPESGTLFVGSRESSVYAVVNDKTTANRQVVTLLSDLKVPNGVAVYERQLYVAEQHRISRFELTYSKQSTPQVKKKDIVFSDLPDKQHHGTRNILFGPDQKLYVTVGSPCNICMPEGIEDALLRMDSNGGNMEVFARGIRNSVGLDFHPLTRVLHFTDNGADGMGDDIPPDELNAAPEPGRHYGFPYYGGGAVRTDETFDKEMPDNTVPPVIEFPAHTANLGVRFYTGNQFPHEYKNDAFVAQHGSWNRSMPDGYRIMRVRFDDEGDVTGKEVFAEGWLKDGKAWGRPVDILQLQDGSLLVSDDYADVVYRISFESGE